MKMQHELCAQVSGQVTHVYAKVGVQVKADAILIVIAPQEVGKAK
jgi:biotin carboxyl carrier protein